MRSSVASRCPPRTSHSWSLSARSVLAALVVVVAAVCPAATTASPGLLKGIDDNAQILYGNPDAVFADLHRLRVRVVRIDLRWDDVAGPTPTVRPTDPSDGQYDWSVYDRAALFAARYHIQVLFA